MSYQDIHLDLKTLIASTSIEAWNSLMRSDPVFGRYALTHRGQVMFSNAFAVMGSDGIWRVLRRLTHRVGGPAFVDEDGTEVWYERGVLQCVGGIVTKNENGEELFDLSRLQRVRGPARVYNGARNWWECGTVQRTAKPAIIPHADRSKPWYELHM